MSKKIASKRNKGKVDFKRKTTDSLMTDKSGGLGDGEEERIVLVMRKCKVFITRSNDTIANFVLRQKSRDEVTLAQHAAFLDVNHNDIFLCWKITARALCEVLR